MGRHPQFRDLISGPAQSPPFSPVPQDRYFKVGNSVCVFVCINAGGVVVDGRWHGYMGFGIGAQVGNTFEIGTGYGRPTPGWSGGFSGSMAAGVGVYGEYSESLPDYTRRQGGGGVAFGYGGGVVFDFNYMW